MDTTLPLASFGLDAAVAPAVGGRHNVIAFNAPDVGQRIPHAKTGSSAASAGLRATESFNRTPRLLSELAHVGVLQGLAATGPSSAPALQQLRWSLEEALASRGVACLSLGEWNRPREKLLEPLSWNRLTPTALVVLGEFPPANLATLKSRVTNLLTVGGFGSAPGPGIAADEAQAATLLIDALAAQGHTYLLWIGATGAPHELSTKANAVIAAAAQRQLRLEHIATLPFEHDREKIGRIAAKAFARRKRGELANPTALVCSDHAVAAGAIDQLRHCGVDVPGEISVVAMDAAQPPALGLPAVTCAGWDPTQAGVETATLILSLLAGAAPRGPATILPALYSPGETLGPVYQPDRDDQRGVMLPAVIRFAPLRPVRSGPPSP